MDSFAVRRAVGRRLPRVAVPALVAALLLIVSTAALAAARPTEPIGPAQGPIRTPTAPPALAGDILLSVRIQPDKMPAVAFNRTDEEYLVVWVSGTQLLAQRLDDRGVPQGEAVDIAVLRNWDAWPVVAFAPSLGRYMVAWTDVGAADRDIFGQLLANDGRPVLGRLELSAGPGDQTAPAVVASAADFLVVWQAKSGTDVPVIEGRMVSSSGLVTAQVWDIAAGGGVARANPSAAYDSLSMSYLVAYEIGDGLDARIGLRAVQAATGAHLGGEVVVAEQPYAVAPRIAVALTGSTSTGLVTWSDLRQASYDVYARALLPGNPPRLPGPDSPVEVAPEDQLRPALAALPTGNFMVAWEDAGQTRASKHDLMGRVMGASGQPVGETFAVSTAPDGQHFADVAVAPASSEALIVWEDHRIEGSDEVFAQRLDRDGAALTTEQDVSAAPDEQAAPVAAYNRDDDQYLVVWQERFGTGTVLRAQRLAVNGLALEVPWLLDYDDHENIEPDVAYSPQGRHYLVAWADTTAGRVELARVPPGGDFVVRDALRDGDGGRRPRLVYDEPGHQFMALWQLHGDIYGTVLDADGTVPQSPRLTVIEGAGNQDQAAVAVDTTRHQYLAVWRGGTAGAEDIYGRLLDALGQPLGEVIALAGGGDDPLPRSAPSVAYDPGGGGYLIAFVAGVTAKDGDIRSRFITAEGGPFGPETAVRDQPAGADQSAPQVTYESATGRYHVLWTELGAGTGGAGTGLDLLGRWMTADGRAASAPLPFARSPGDQRNPRVAPDDENGRLLAVWEDTRRGKVPDIYGRIGVLDTLPPTAFLSVDPSAGPPGTAFRLDASASHDDATPAGALTVRWDWTSDGSYDTAWVSTKVVTRTVRAAGTYTVTVEVRDAVGLTASAARALRVVAGTVNRVPTAALRVSPDTGAAGTVFRFDASASTDPETPAAELEVRWDWEADGAYDTPWSRDKVEQRSLTAAGTQRVRLEVRDEAGLTASALASVRVTAGPTARLEVSPGSATLRSGEQVRFFAATWDRYDNPSSNAGVRWLLRQPGIGAIDARGVFTAGSRAGTFPDLVRAADGAVGDGASVTIIAQQPVIHLPWATRGR